MTDAPGPYGFGAPGQPVGRHPLIDGLFATLPATGAPWTAAERTAWLAAAAAIFALIYRDAPRAAVSGAHPDNSLYHQRT
jgi:hypothetical protein